MSTGKLLATALRKHFPAELSACFVEHDEVTIEVKRTSLLTVCQALRDEPEFGFKVLMDLSGVDYLTYGHDEWVTDDATCTGFGRGVEKKTLSDAPGWAGARFAVAYHLLSLKHNVRLRVRVFAEDEPPRVPSVIEIWNAANWYEREAFDLFGILFEGHPDLRRILTDYGFIGHPFRKDFPLSGHVEVRYDPGQQRVVYEPVSIEPRVLVPRVIRRDKNAEAAPAEAEGVAKGEATS